MNIIKPDWLVPANIHALTTTREGGVSLSPFNSLNLGDHVGDNPNAVKQNRALLTQYANLPHSPIYLTQIHSTKVLRLPLAVDDDRRADAVYTDQPNQVCLVMTADCLPVLFCSQDGSEIAAAHAGWRGLCDGMLEATIKEFRCPTDEIIVWLGPAISQKAFQVGQEVIEQFCSIDPQAQQAFIPDPNTSGKFLGDLYHIARQRLNKMGINQIYGGSHCTFSESNTFFSYRRDQTTGRMATLIWRE